MIGFVLKTVYKAFSALTTKERQGGVGAAVQAYVYFDANSGKFVDLKDENAITP